MHTETASYCALVSKPAMTGGHCFGVGAALEHWGIPGESYTHAAANGLTQLTHRCRGRLCSPLNPIALDATMFTDAIRDCYCDWSQNTRPPTAAPAACVAADPGLIWGDDNRLRDLGAYVGGYRWSLH